MSRELPGTLGKGLQAAGIWAVVLLILAAVWWPAIQLPELWIVVSVSMLSNALQPSYRPFEGSRTPEDRGTAAQILWTVYLTLGAALLELVCRHRRSIPLDPLSCSALAAMIGGLALRTWAVVVLGQWFTWNITVQAGQELVSRGPYRWIRHPSYTGALMVFVASCLLLRSWVAGVVAAVALSWGFLRRIRYEEALLVRSLPGYDAYRSRTGGMFPRWRPS